jgi:hypothetical protein
VSAPTWSRSRLCRSCTLAFAALVWTAAPTDGQTAARPAGATPTSILFNFSGGCAFDEDAAAGAVKAVADLAHDYNDGNRWPQLQQELRSVLASCIDDAQPAAARDLSGALTKTMLVAFVERDTPYYVVLPSRQPYRLTITGRTSVVPIVLVDAAARRDPPPDMHFMSSRIDDPRQEIPAFVRDIAGSIIKQYRTGNAPAKSNPRFWAYAADEVELPFRRASVVESGTLTVNCEPNGSSVVLAVCPRGKDSLGITIATTYTTTPETRMDFAAVAGGVVGPYRGHLKMKVDAGRYASDPARHAMTMAAIAIHVKPYDATLPDISMPERWSLLVGGILTPAAGAGAGLSFAFMRGFAINAGEMVIWVPTGSSPGAIAPDGSNQLPHRYAYGTFVGASYSLSR